jgi:protein phosphatase methylesterase 1
MLICVIFDLVWGRPSVFVFFHVLGTALEALASMQNFLRGRPSVFKSLEHAIEWW